MIAKQKPISRQLSPADCETHECLQNKGLDETIVV